MKPLLTLLTALLLGTPALAEIIPVNGVAENGYAGVYEINGNNYWWMCVEPTGTPAAGLGQSFIADSISFAEGWSSQNSERYAYYHVDNPSYLTTVIPKQVAVMSYVLDTYLPWGSAGASGRFIEQDSDVANYDNNDTFYNAIFAVQAFLAETYGKEAQSDFTDLSNFVDRWIQAGDVTAAGLARSAIFQSILDDVEGLDGTNYFDTYEAQHGYLIANTSYPLGDTDNNWQDALLIQSFAPVPEPSGALLIGCFGIVVLLRRCRRAAAPAFDA
jgi:hypothetical protein